MTDATIEGFLLELGIETHLMMNKYNQMILFVAFP
jgi:hypothetical protein